MSDIDINKKLITPYPSEGRMEFSWTLTKSLFTSLNFVHNLILFFQTKLFVPTN